VENIVETVVLPKGFAFAFYRTRPASQVLIGLYLIENKMLMYGHTTSVRIVLSVVCQNCVSYICTDLQQPHYE